MWIADQFDPATLGEASLNIWRSLEEYFSFHEEDRARELVGVGYSGGFLTLGEVLANNVYKANTNTGYNAVSLVGLGGTNIQLDGVFKDAMDKTLAVGEFLTKGTFATMDFLSTLRGGLDALVALAAGPAGAVSLTQVEADQVYNTVKDVSIDAGYDAFVAIVQQKTWNAFAPSLTSASQIGVVVNVYGTRNCEQGTVPTGDR